ncbi:N-acetyltransferase eso1 [Microbotryomycetes sp. JL221]|nr:N-acetyltransferase eso1 [Microbotryomycetes sp. JL221]
MASHASTSRSTSLAPGGQINVAFVPPKRNASGVSMKGKERALEQDDTGSSYNNTTPTVTYRHILGKGDGGPGNPLRCIAHIDIDAAYAAFEMARLGIDPNQPLAVQQWNGLIAVNYPARAFGITRHEPPAEALKKCPNLMLVHVATYRIGDQEPGYWIGAKPETHKVSLDPYRRESLRILKCFGEFGPIVEKASIDESYMDVTMPVRTQLLKLYPSLAQLPPGATLDTPLPTPQQVGVELDWSKVGNLVPIHGQSKEELPKPNSEEASTTTTEDHKKSVPLMTAVLPQEDESELSWSDVALYLGAGIVKQCRSAVEDRLGYTCSAGIARNKMLAKLCSAWKKPNNQTILRNAAIPAFLKPMPFQKIRNLGGKLGNQVSDVYGANTVGDLLQVVSLDIGLPEMQAKLGDESGTWLYEIIRGIDYTEVEPKTQVKSMISSKNFRPYITKYSEALHWINILATELHLRLKEARELSPGLWPKTLVFSHRSPDYVVRSHQSPFPFTSKLSIEYIVKHGEKLLRTAIGQHPNVPVTASSSSTARATGTNVSNGKTTSDFKIGPYNNMMLSLTGLDRAEQGQKGLESFFNSATTTTTGKTMMNVDGVSKDVDLTSEKTEVKNDIKKRRAEQGALERDSDAQVGRSGFKKSKTKATQSKASTFFTPKDMIVLVDSDDDGDDDQDSKYKEPSLHQFELGQSRCERCQQQIALTRSDLVKLDNDEQIKQSLQKLIDEHHDWHFAKDMFDQDRTRDRNSVSAVHRKKSKLKAVGDSTNRDKKTSSTATVSSSMTGTGQQSLTKFFGS